MAQRDFRSICSHSWMTTSNECKPVTWFHWENVKAGSLTRLARVEKQSTSEGLVEALQKDLQTFSYHLFSARWQWEQYKNISTDVHENTIVFCMDFGENYTCCPQDASQGCHWTNTKCTTHPIVASYTCNKCEVEEGRARPTMTVTASVIIISSDLQHDKHAVQHFIGKTVQLQQQEGLQFSKVILFSDGAPTQYKNRISFADCFFAPFDFGVQTERHYFGSCHGKGPSDREIGVVKKTVNRYVKARQTNVASAEDFFSLCCN